MIGKFYDSFCKKQDDKRELPKEVLDALNDKLPNNFEYIKDDYGRYRVVPKEDEVNEDINITTQIAFDEEKDKAILDRLDRIPKDKWDEYFYRTNMRIPIKNIRIGDKDKTMPIEELTNNPLLDYESSFVDGFMQANDFSNPFEMVFKSPEGDVAKIKMLQEAYDSLTEIKYVNIDFPALKIEIYIYSPLLNNCEEDAHTNENRQLVVNYSVTPTKAQSVKEAVAALHIFGGLYNGTTQINGYTISQEGTEAKFDSKNIEDALSFWESVLKLEEKMNLKFNPQSTGSKEEVQLFTELQTCILERKSIVWRHPFNHFRIDGAHSFQEGMSIEDYLKKESVNYQFLEGPISITFLGTTFNVYSRTEMRDFKITNIEWIDEKKKRQRCTYRMPLIRNGL